jgi:serine/threonine-protein kinase
MSNKAFDQTLFEQLLKRIAEGETVETDQLPEQFLAAPEVQALLKLSRVASRLDHNVAGGSPRPQADLRGARLGGYRLTRLLGAGGMGQVWLAERDDHSIEHAVAIKRLSIDHTSSPAGRHFAARLREERRILARLDHPTSRALSTQGLRKMAHRGLPWSMSMALV